jgi:hypothetical protein
MKLFSIHYVDGLQLLDKNHKKFCKLNNIEHNKIVLQEKIAAKYTFILEQLQRNYGETLIFVDSYSFFNNFSIKIDLSKKDLWFQQGSNESYDNFIVITSNHNNLKLFSNLSHEINEQLFGKRDSGNLMAKLPDNYLSAYNFSENNQVLNTRINWLNSLEEAKNSLVVSTDSAFPEERSHYFAEALCAAKDYTHTENETYPDFEVINPNKKKALVTLYTEEIKEYGKVCEESLKKFCLKNNHTLYVYRKVPEQLKRMSGSWTKPYVLLKHIGQHDYIAWVDSDIIIGNKFENIFEDDVSVFRDPSNWKFNSGFMVFKNTQKNYELLMDIVKEFSKLGDMKGVYSSGGDQKYFIEVILKNYPNIIPYSSNIANTHPVYPTLINPYIHKDKLLHFMGFKNFIRAGLMKGFSVLLNK